MKRILTLIVCIAALTSCATTRYYSGFTNSQAAQGMALLGPASTIFFIDKDNSEYYDESMSAASDMLVGRIAGEMGLPISGTMPLDSLQREEAVVTLGMVVPYVTPTAHTSAVSAAILDSYTDRVVFYGVNQPSESDPLQEGTIRRQLKRLLKGFVQ